MSDPPTAPDRKKLPPLATGAVPVSPLPRRTSQLDAQLLLAKASAAEHHQPPATAPGPPVGPSVGERRPSAASSAHPAPLPHPVDSHRSTSEPVSLPDHLASVRDRISAPITITSPGLKPNKTPPPADALSPLVGGWWGSRRPSWYELASEVARALTPGSAAASPSPAPGWDAARDRPRRTSWDANAAPPRPRANWSRAVEEDTHMDGADDDDGDLTARELEALRSSIAYYEEYRRKNLLHDLPEEGGPVHVNPLSELGGQPEPRRRSVWQEAADTFRMAAGAAGGGGKRPGGGGLFDFDLDFSLDGDELSSSGRSRERKFLGEYSEPILVRACVDMGLADELAGQGYTDLVLRIDDKDPFVHRLTITDESLFEREWEQHGRRGPHGDPATLEEYAREAPLRDDNYLVDMFARVHPMPLSAFKTYQQLLRLRSGDTSFLLHSLSPDKAYAPLMDLTVEEISEVVGFMEAQLGAPDAHGGEHDPPKYTEISWLSCQNPRLGWVRRGGGGGADPTRGGAAGAAGGTPPAEDAALLPPAATARRPSRASLRAPLPGQKYPGSGLAKRITFMLVSFVRWRGRAALINTPEMWHNAFLYWHKGFMFLNPAFQGFFMAAMLDMNEDIKRHGLPAVAWAWKMGQVTDERGRMVVWLPTHEQLHPTSPLLSRYFASDGYAALADRFAARYRGRFRADVGGAVRGMVEGFEREVGEHPLAGE